MEARGHPRARYHDGSPRSRAAMPLTLTERTAVAALARHLYDYLPASGNGHTAFPLAAAKVGVGQGWPLGKVSKEPGIVALLSWTLEHHRGRFCDLMQEVVAQSLSWRGRGRALSREDIVELNRLLLGVQFKVPAFNDPAFLTRLPSDDPTSGVVAAPATVDEAVYAKLMTNLMQLSALDPHPRGYAFEHFLTDLFAAFGLAPRGSFRNTGEQIDGSFVLHHDTYLLEAKWHGPKIGVKELHAFAGKVRDKATWSRGLFISESGFSDEGLEAFGRSQPVVCVEGLDLYETLHRKRRWPEVLAAKVRRASETGRPFVRVRDLF